VKAKLYTREGISEHEATGDYEAHEAQLLIEIDIPATDSWPEVLLIEPSPLSARPLAGWRFIAEASAYKISIAKRNQKAKGDGPDRC
jgi:hypothetical protein